ncbi:hypothetical protein NOS3756_39940 [Nostoc sp. NIES-3756]|jgi:hypothetical protein|uniref:hypothetical protein n=1 Tax=Nostoc sp. NIES-3756 TaxID=1751286 RepID=UPI000721C82E|nr:hypothetical protein [Nostoc sp. NIES-3756]BAT55017.1 hypothetical protein NOS3756_39940 [Nostoc sp. NIES-3756]BAY37199.1 hypothetical protein NIES2111_15350 [Nostoc sp. NIES-2111]
MFGFIKNLFAGILSFLTGLIGGKKSGGYYLELKEDTTEEKAPAPSPKAAPAAPAASNGTKAAVKAEVPPATEKSPVPTPAKVEASKPAKVEASKNGKNGKAAPKPAEPEKAPVAKTTTPTETTFAPKYLAPSASGSNGRRRPGANMTSFLDMASQVKTPG